jgi:hypothetical protein
MYYVVINKPTAQKTESGNKSYWQKEKYVQQADSSVALPSGNSHIQTSKKDDLPSVPPIFFIFKTEWGDFVRL